MADNSLNVSELFRRLGVKGDSLGSAPLLESLRLSLLIGDLSDLVPPLGVPFGASTITSTSGVATVNQWSLACRSPGGLTVRTLRTATAGVFRVFVTPVNPFGAIVSSSAHNFSFGQAVRSAFSSHVPAGPAAPAFSLEIADAQPSFGLELDNWVGPGEFFNIEAGAVNQAQEIAITWKEFPAGLNPG